MTGRKNGCPDCGKVRYGTRADAKRAANQQPVRIRVYRCGAFWHLTSAPLRSIAYFRGRPS